MPESRIWKAANELVFDSLTIGKGRAVGGSIQSLSKTTGNEDAAAVFELGDDCIVMVVADGVGGANAGDRASAEMIDRLQQSLVATNDSLDLRTAILDAIETANREILGWGIGAACTVAIVLYDHGTIRSFHAGDAMVLLCSNHGTLRFTTVSHAPVAMGVEAGLIDEEDALVHEDRNIITNCVGSNEMRIEIGPQLQMQSRDTLLLASDGLSDNLLNNEIIESIRTGSLDNNIQQLIQQTRERMIGTGESAAGKPDDLTILGYRQYA